MRSTILIGDERFVLTRDVNFIVNEISVEIILFENSKMKSFFSCRIGLRKKSPQKRFEDETIFYLRPVEIPSPKTL
jgi:hypothetical protein